ncbi:MAG: hybrid sensor histidine kinase/response regulator [Bacteroidota bacterium]|nr:hybrid sensor histidine kinase/response regulator [Bacteroidota bacterium]
MSEIALKKETILVADDDLAAVKLYEMILKENGYAVLSATDGLQCVQVAAENLPDLIILDVFMPELDGYEAITRLRQLPHLRYVPIVFLTGHDTTPENIEKGYRLGGTEYWAKPIDGEEFLARIRSILRGAKAEKDLRTLRESFNYMIIHDLRGPLSGISGYVELLKEDKEKIPPEDFEMITGIGEAAGIVFEIIRDFLEVSRIEAGTLHVLRQPVLLRPIIEKSRAHFAQLVQQKEIEIVVDVDSTPMFLADTELLEEVFSNLLDNALRFTDPKGTISITARLGERNDASNVIITVADTGAGIPPEDIPMLFDKNRIMTAGAKRAGAHTGLGLPICKGIIEAHGGTITVSSELQRGTTFIIILPFKSAE